MFVDHYCNGPQFGPIRNQSNTVHILITSYHKIHFNIILSSRLHITIGLLHPNVYMHLFSQAATVVA
jgi:hypothetical protein